MISIPGSLSLVMSSAPAKTSAGDARSIHPSIHGNQRCPIQTRLQSVLGVVRSSYVERNNIDIRYSLSIAFLFVFFSCKSEVLKREMLQDLIAIRKFKQSKREGSKEIITYGKPRRISNNSVRSIWF